jgi:hypothetical protein
MGGSCTKVIDRGRPERHDESWSAADALRLQSPPRYLLCRAEYLISPERFRILAEIVGTYPLQHNTPTSHNQM